MRREAHLADDHPVEGQPTGSRARGGHEGQLARAAELDRRLCSGRLTHIIMPVHQSLWEGEKAAGGQPGLVWSRRSAAQTHQSFRY